jgi:ABC-type antimicrobial peptide transport system permease subunit
MHLDGWNPWMAALLGVIASSLVGLLAGVLPAVRAARLHPAEALR